MRSTQRNDGHNPVAPGNKSFRNANLQRRGFLLTLGVGGAGAAAVAARKLSGNMVAPGETREPDADGSGYQMTEHVRRYYQTAKL
jgi:hypothetical protein